MRLVGFTLALASVFASNALGQAPTINSDGTGAMNALSFVREWAPNYGVARGSYFVVYGTNFSATPVYASLPLKTTLGGVSVNVTVNGTTTPALISFANSTQINAIVPSATPAGTGTFTVTTSAGASAPSPIQVVDGAFGLLTWNYGSGAAKGYDASVDPSNQYILFGCPSCPAVNPGDVLELFGTGLGPVANDGTLVPVTPPAKVYIGGILATVQYSGRSSYEAEDQINVVVPTGVTGCYVDIAVVTGNYASNFATLAVAAKGSRTCSDTTTPLPASILNGIAQNGSFSVGGVSVSKTTSPGIMGIGGGTKDSGSASFFKYTSINTAAFAGAYAFSSIGGCSVWTFSAGATSQSAPEPFQFTSLNAGPDININGPDGAIAMPLQTVSGFNIYSTPSSDTSFIPSSGGSFTFDNGASGGKDIGAFSVLLQMAPPVTWSNMASDSTITRSAGVTVNWTGGDPTTYVTITGLSLGSMGDSVTDFVAGLFTCQAPTSAGTFTVSPAVLLSVPASTTIEGISLSTLSLSNVTSKTFTATGLDYGYASATVEDTTTATYQ
jgi:uncharacterized protein (TIGR03437 family)